jgi:hypothetical protein
LDLLRSSPAALAGSLGPLELSEERSYKARRRRRELLQDCDHAAHVAGIIWRRQRDRSRRSHVHGIETEQRVGAHAEGIQHAHE